MNIWKHIFRQHLRQDRSGVMPYAFPNEFKHVRIWLKQPKKKICQFGFSVFGIPEIQ